MLIALSIGMPAGHRRRGARTTPRSITRRRWPRCGACRSPNFWLGILLILLFSVELGWLPASGYVSPFESLKQNLLTLIMPAFVLGNAIAAVHDAPHAQRDAAGARRRLRPHRARQGPRPSARVVLKHALRNALIPVITLGALEFGALLSGAVLTEQVFTIPGFGKLIVDAVFNRDYAVVQGVVLCHGDWPTSC